MFGIRVVSVVFAASISFAHGQWVTSGTGIGKRQGDQGLISMSTNAGPSVTPPTATAISATPAIGQTLVESFDATDPDGDELEYTLLSATPSIFQIDAATGSISLASIDGITLATERENPASLMVRVSDGDLFADIQVSIPFEPLPMMTNAVPQIIVPADWTPSPIAHNAANGDELISVLSAVDDDNDPLTWSISAMDLPVFSINEETGAISLSAPDNIEAQEARPASLSLTVQVTDGMDIAEHELTVPVAAVPAGPTEPPLEFGQCSGQQAEIHLGYGREHLQPAVFHSGAHVYRAAVQHA